MMQVLPAVTFGSLISVSAHVPVDPGLLAPLLPATLRLMEPTVVVQAGHFTSEVCGNFCSASLSVPVTRGSDVGSFPLVMLIDSEVAMMFGRERYGEPKRLARVTISPNDYDLGQAVSVVVERERRVLFSCGFWATGEDEGGEVTAHTFNLKTLLSVAEQPLGATYLVSAVARARADHARLGSLRFRSECDGRLTQALAGAARDGVPARCTRGSIVLGMVTEERLCEPGLPSVHGARQNLIESFVRPRLQRA